LTVNPSMYSKLPYDVQRDFTPVAGLGLVPLVLVANPKFVPNTVGELVALAKAKPGQINYASGGNGVTNHLVMEMFKHTAGISMVHVPYKGGPAALNDLIGGQVDVMFETALAALPFVQQGKLKALAVSSEARAAAAPKLPTISESGYPGFSGVPWVAMVAPSGTPVAVVNKLNAEIVQMMKAKDVQQQLDTMGTQAMLQSPKELGGFIESEMAKWKEAIKVSGAKIE
jgi:tripartite-type tricarboxylate transporter receptor subunit TctC